MIMNKERELVPGSVVYSKYSKFDGTESLGIFLIIYSESRDTTNMNQRNYLVMKMTTSLVGESQYVVHVDSNKEVFMNQDGYVACSKLHTISQEQIQKKFGELSPSLMKKVYKVYHKFQFEVERQFLETI
jgi:mRNA-degrading endonuclease toxin of MazEF toxin-antitoxin module